MNLIVQLLLELVSMAPGLVGDGENVYNALHAAPDAAAKADAVAKGVQHLATTLAPVLAQVGK